MSRSRNRLHKTKLKEFSDWLLWHGWAPEKCKGFYEVLRMRHPDQKELLLVYDRNDAKEHYTTFGISNDMLNKFLRLKRSA